MERIKEQIANTEALIEQEVKEFKTLHGIEPLPEDRSTGDTAVEETVGEHHTDSSPVIPVAESDSTNPLSSTQVPESGRTQTSAERDPLEENGEVIFEGDEDTVIY